jgi:hypothetical protein
MIAGAPFASAYLSWLLFLTEMEPNERLVGGSASLSGVDSACWLCSSEEGVEWWWCRIAFEQRRGGGGVTRWRHSSLLPVMSCDVKINKKKRRKKESIPWSLYARLFYGEGCTSGDCGGQKRPPSFILVGEALQVPNRWWWAEKALHLMFE